MQALENALKREKLAELFKCLIFIMLQRRTAPRTVVEDHSAVSTCQGSGLISQQGHCKTGDATSGEAQSAFLNSHM